MGKHSAKRFVSNEKKEPTLNRNAKIQVKKSSKLKRLIIIILLFIIIIFAIPHIKDFFTDYVYEVTKDFFDNFSSESEETASEPISISSILETNPNTSPYSTKNIMDTELYVNNLFLKYENNITVINFDICNNSSINQDIFNFTFSLLDENNKVIISYDLSSEEIIEANQKKDFVLIATRDVSNASDFSISIKK